MASSTSVPKSQAEEPTAAGVRISATRVEYTLDADGDLLEEQKRIKRKRRIRRTARWAAFAGGAVWMVLVYFSNRATHKTNVEISEAQLRTWHEKKAQLAADPLWQRFAPVSWGRLQESLDNAETDFGKAKSAGTVRRLLTDFTAVNGTRQSLVKDLQNASEACMQLWPETKATLENKSHARCPIHQKVRDPQDKVCMYHPVDHPYAFEVWLENGDYTWRGADGRETQLSQKEKGLQCPAF